MRFFWTIFPALFLLSGTAQAAGFYIQEQSVTGLGSAFAGIAANPQDASTIYFNPAGMTELDGPEISVSNHALFLELEVKNENSTAATAATGGTSIPYSGSNGTNPYDIENIPNFYAALPVSEDGDWWVGLGITAPFGLSNEYNNGWFGRYDSTESDLRTHDFAPSIAWKINEKFSIGGGLNLQFVHGKLEKALPSPATAGGPMPATDGLQDLSGRSIETGFNAGLLYQPTSSTNIGVTYRSSVNHKIEGRAIVINPLDIPVIGGVATSTGAEAVVKFPDIASVAVAHDVTDRLRLLGHATWFGWSDFDAINIRLATGATSTIEQNYDDSYALAAGVQYRMRNDWTLRAGYQFDKTPTKDNFRTTRTPDGDRQWFATGMSYDLNEHITLDLAATYIMIKEEDINLSPTFSTGTVEINGRTKGPSVGIVSAGIRYRF